MYLALFALRASLLLQKPFIYIVYSIISMYIKDI